MRKKPSPACEMCGKGSFGCSCTGALQIGQTPRFIGVKTKQTVSINCVTSADAVQWYRLDQYDDDRSKAAEVKKGDKEFLISSARVEDTGVYFCKVNHTWGPGTELRVSSKAAAERASSLVSANVAAERLSSSARTSQPSQAGVQDADEGRPHHPPGSAAGRVYRGSHATQASAGEERALKVVVGLYYTQGSFKKNKQTHSFWN